MDTTIDPGALHHHLSRHAVVPTPHTVLPGVRKLPPATVRVIEGDGRSREHRHRAPDHVRREEYASFSEQDWADAVLASSRTAVARRTVADVPVGVLLSGGLESSLVTALLAEQGRTDLATCSIGFEPVGGRDGDEFECSVAIVQWFATNHHRIGCPAPNSSGRSGTRSTPGEPAHRGTIDDVTDDLHPDHVVIEAGERPGLAHHAPRPTAARFPDLLPPETRGFTGSAQQH